MCVSKYLCNCGYHIGDEFRDELQIKSNDAKAFSHNEYLRIKASFFLHQLAIELMPSAIYSVSSSFSRSVSLSQFLFHLMFYNTSSKITMTKSIHRPYKLFVVLGNKRRCVRGG